MKDLRLFRISVFIGLAITAGAFLLFIKKSLTTEMPTVVIFSIDTLRADHLGCYGYFRMTSKYIDAFAKESVLFENAISQSPSTTPSHMSLFTALTPGVHGLTGFTENEQKGCNRLNERIETMPAIFKKNGYFTAGLHGGGGVAPEFGFDRGFDIYQRWWDMRLLKQRVKDVRMMIKKGKERKQPLFLFFHHYICHDPYLKAPDKFNLRFLSRPVPGIPMHPEEITNDKDIFIRRNDFWKNVDLSKPAHREHIIALYDGGVSYADYLFGEVIDVLKKEKLYDDAIIVLISDHGEEFYEHMDNLHWRLFIETLHVPLIVKFPRGTFSGRRISQYVQIMDIMPTLFDYLGIRADIFVQGKSFMPFLTGQRSESHFVVSYDDANKSTRFTKDNFVYSNQASHGVVEWLFDITKDPEETKNLEAHEMVIRNQMRIDAARILERDKAIREKIGCAKKASVPKSDLLIKELKALGYLQ